MDAVQFEDVVQFERVAQPGMLSCAVLFRVGSSIVSYRIVSYRIVLAIAPSGLRAKAGRALSPKEATPDIQESPGSRCSSGCAACG